MTLATASMTDPPRRPRASSGVRWPPNGQSPVKARRQRCHSRARFAAVVNRMAPPRGSGAASPQPQCRAQNSDYEWICGRTALRASRCSAALTMIKKALPAAFPSMPQTDRIGCSTDRRPVDNSVEIPGSLVDIVKKGRPCMLAKAQSRGRSKITRDPA